jgi:hypothetical protein
MGFNSAFKGLNNQCSKKPTTRKPIRNCKAEDYGNERVKLKCPK